VRSSVPFLQNFIVLIFISLVILGLDSVRILALPKIALYSLTNPLALGIYQTSQGISKQFYFIFAARFAAQENKALKEQLGQLTTENANISKELRELKAQLEQENISGISTYQTIAARPIGVDRYLKIDKGSSDGVKINSAVVFKDNFIGKVITVTEKGASVMLTSDPDSAVAAFSINKEGKAKGILKGQFGEEILFSEVLHEEVTEKGDLVYSEGTEGYLPRGLVLGQISEVLGKEHEVFKETKVKELFDIRDFDLVFVISE
jgi:rod shape-determining protein MreC